MKSKLKADLFIQYKIIHCLSRALNHASCGGNSKHETWFQPVKRCIIPFNKHLFPEHLLPHQAQCQVLGREG